MQGAGGDRRVEPFQGRAPQRARMSESETENEIIDPGIPKTA